MSKTNGETNYRSVKKQWRDKLQIRQKPMVRQIIDLSKTNGKTNFGSVEKNNGVGKVVGKGSGIC